MNAVFAQKNQFVRCFTFKPILKRSRKFPGTLYSTCQSKHHPLDDFRKLIRKDCKGKLFQCNLLWSGLAIRDKSIARTRKDSLLFAILFCHWSNMSTNVTDDGKRQFCKSYTSLPIHVFVSITFEPN
ncbi:hypothetical protein HNY73_017499 [Argiope bruennichi]|uniref:Uncharacterized protein n=1 Tax=Argiope bruennichi TaxID=94029 RepID=A0A8T0ECV7_ARGBR|nr:hypothetical protein HNY73_017499 [Argiope bruennichi]